MRERFCLALNSVSVGMGVDEVQRLVGEPDQVVFEGGYQLWESALAIISALRSTLWYVVKIPSPQNPVQITNVAATMIPATPAHPDL